MEEERRRVSRLQRNVAAEVVIERYDLLVGCINAIRIFPYLVSSKVLQQKYRQYLDCERTDDDKMMALLREVTRSPMENWFNEFIGALSQFPQYHDVAEMLKEDFAKLMEKRLADPPPEEGSVGASPPSSLADAGYPVLHVNIDNLSGFDDVMKKAMDDAHETTKKAMEAANEGHKTALSELQKASSRVLEAEKGKVYAEAEKKILEGKYSELSVKQCDIVERLREAEMHIQLLEKEARTSKNEAEQAEKKMNMEKMQLNEDLATSHLKEEAAREKAQEMEARVASLQMEAEKVEKERNKEVTSLEHQLSEARKQKQAVEEELKVVWKEMGETRTRLENATRQLEEVQASREEELGQLERSVARMGELEKELAEEKQAKVRLTQVKTKQEQEFLKTFKEKQAKMEDLEKELDVERKVKVQVMQNVKELEMKLEEKSAEMQKKAKDMEEQLAESQDLLRCQEDKHKARERAFAKMRAQEVEEARMRAEAEARKARIEREAEAEVQWYKKQLEKARQEAKQK